MERVALKAPGTLSKSRQYQIRRVATLRSARNAEWAYLADGAGPEDFPNLPDDTPACVYVLWPGLPGRLRHFLAWKILGAWPLSGKWGAFDEPTKGTFGDLRALTDGEFADQPNLGATSLKEFRKTFPGPEAEAKSDLKARRAFDREVKERALLAHLKAKYE